MKLSEHFELREFTRNPRGIPNDPPSEVIPVLREFCEQVLEPLRAHVGLPVSITSGYRSTELNRRVGGAPDSYHCATPARCAADIGELPMSHKMFASCLSERGFRKQRMNSGIVYYGVGLLTKEVYDTRPSREPEEERWSSLGRMREPGED